MSHRYGSKAENELHLSIPILHHFAYFQHTTLALNSASTLHAVSTSLVCTFAWSLFYEVCSTLNWFALVEQHDGDLFLVPAAASPSFTTHLHRERLYNRVSIINNLPSNLLEHFRKTKCTGLAPPAVYFKIFAV